MFECMFPWFQISHAQAHDNAMKFHKVGFAHQCSQGLHWRAWALFSTLAGTLMGESNFMISSPSFVKVWYRLLGNQVDGLPLVSASKGCGIWIAWFDHFWVLWVEGALHCWRALASKIVFGQKSFEKHGSWKLMILIPPRMPPHTCNKKLCTVWPRPRIPPHTFVDFPNNNKVDSWTPFRLADWLASWLHQ